jgi:hypothetical protein
VAAAAGTPISLHGYSEQRHWRIERSLEELDGLWKLDQPILGQISAPDMAGINRELMGLLLEISE